MKAIIVLLIICFSACKEKKKENYPVIPYSPLYTMAPIDVARWREALKSIEEKKLDTVIALLKNQNKLLEKQMHKKISAKTYSISLSGKTTCFRTLRDRYKSRYNIYQRKMKSTPQNKKQ